MDFIFSKYAKVRVPVLAPAFLQVHVPGAGVGVDAGADAGYGADAVVIVVAVSGCLCRL